MAEYGDVPPTFWLVCAVAFMGGPLGCLLGYIFVWRHPRIATKDEPNAFHRWMQRFCFGVKWEKRDG